MVRVSQKIITSHRPVPRVFEAGQLEAGLSPGAVLLRGLKGVAAGPGVGILGLKESVS